MQRDLQVRQWALYQTIALFEMQQKVMPQRMLRQNFGVAQNDKTIFGSRHGHIQAPWIAQEANALVVVRSHARQHNEIFLSALECINRCNLDLLVSLFLERARCLHGADDIAALSLIRSDYPNVLWLNARLEEPSHNLLHIRRLGSVKVRSARSRNLLVT